MAEQTTSPDDEVSKAADENPVAPAGLDDNKTDAAVEDIEHQESDEVLAAEESKHFTPPAKAWYKKFLSNKKFLIPAVIVLILAVLAAVPFTRYQIVGLVEKRDFAVTVIDAKTNQPVSEATISLAGQTAQTDNQGKATLRIKVGSSQLKVTKQYYATFTAKVTVPILKQKTIPSLDLQATGRQVPLTIVDKISGAPIADALISAANAQARTAKNGTVTMVLPADKSSVSATITASGYNSFTGTITVTTAAVPGNKFAITPAGKIYFLSNLSGKIDVVKTNLDGSDRQTVLAGTGNEDPQNTVLLASRDWKYLALLAQRDNSGNATLYLINTSNDNLSTIDNGNASFVPVGWSNDRFIYQINRNSVAIWQSGQEVLKSFDATSGKITTLDQTTASGTGQDDYTGQNFGNVYIFGTTIVYIKNWYAAYNITDMQQLLSDQATLNSVNNDGTAQKTIKGFAASAGTQTTNVLLSAEAYDATELYLAFLGGGSQSFYEYSDGQVKAAPSSVTNASFYQTNYPTFLLSPSGSQTFWAEPRDGKNTLFTGDNNGENGKQIATLSDYTPYGWYTDNYLLVEKNGSELYIMSPTGGTPLKISDYYKPAQNFNGYGGGYGGL